MGDPRFGLALALADDELILGHRLSEWTGWVPYLEADLALSSIAQDELGHARALYQLIVSHGWAEHEDPLALGREPESYRHAVICERPNTDYAFTLARQWLYDHADRVRCDALADSTWREIAGLLRTIRLEEDYHLAHADTWVRRLADGPLDARHRLVRAIASALPDALSLFEPLEDEGTLIADGVLPVPSTHLLQRWLDAIGGVLDEIGVDRMLLAAEMVPTSSGAIEADAAPSGLPGLIREEARWRHDGSFSAPSGRRGEHSDAFLPLWAELTALHRADPAASW